MIIYKFNYKQYSFHFIFEREKDYVLNRMEPFKFKLDFIYFLNIFLFIYSNPMAQPAIRFNNNSQYSPLKLEHLTTLKITQLPLILILLTPTHIAELTKLSLDPQATPTLPQPESPSTIPEVQQWLHLSRLFFI